MPYALRSGISYTIVGPQFIVLDTVADRYFALSGEIERAFRRLRQNDPDERTGDADAKLLVERGLIVPAHRGALAPTTIRSHEDASRIPQHISSWQATLQACVGILDLRCRLRRSSFQNVLKRVSPDRRIGRTAEKMARDGVAVVVAAFETAKIFLPSHDRCLSHSLAMGRALRRRGIGCDIVLGVATKPFSAHCWVQREGCVLNDDLEHVRTFSPILVI